MTNTFYGTHVVMTHTFSWHTRYDTHIFMTHTLWHTHFHDTHVMIHTFSWHTRYDTHIFMTHTLWHTHFHDTHVMTHTFSWHTRFITLTFHDTHFMTHTFSWHTRYDTHIYYAHFSWHTFLLQVPFALFTLALFTFLAVSQAIPCFVPCSFFVGQCGVTNASACAAGERYVNPKEWCTCCSANCCSACVTTVGRYMIRQHIVNFLWPASRCAWLSHNPIAFLTGLPQVWHRMVLFTVTDWIVWLQW
jgi:hypothetical protein